MNVDSYVRRLDPTPSGDLDNPDSYEAQRILVRAKQPESSPNHKRAMRGGLALGALGMAAVVALVVSGTAAPAKAPTPVHQSGPVMALASLHLHLPPQYRLTPRATTPHCPGLDVTYVNPAPPSGADGDTVTRADVPKYAPEDAVNAGTEGGCIAMVLAPPYTPSATDPDPEGGAAAEAQSVQVGPYNGYEGTSTLYLNPTDRTRTLVWLYVQIPLTGGQDQDLAVSSTGLSERELVSLVANGLSVAGSDQPNNGGRAS